jgi:hypothetical protein
MSVPAALSGKMRLIDLCNPDRKSINYNKKYPPGRHKMEARNSARFSYIGAKKGDMWLFWIWVTHNNSICVTHNVSGYV